MLPSTHSALPTCRTPCSKGPAALNHQRVLTHTHTSMGHQDELFASLPHEVVLLLKIFFVVSVIISLCIISSQHLLPVDALVKRLCDQTLTSYLFELRNHTDITLGLSKTQRTSLLYLNTRHTSKDNKLSGHILQ